jgi:hypothetical protein
VADFGGVWSLGQFLPPIGIRFIDDLNNPSPYIGEVQFRLETPGMLTKCDEEFAPVRFDLNLDLYADGLLQFYENQWMAYPETNDGSYMSPTAVQTKQVDFELSIYAVRDDEIGEQIGTSKIFTMSYSAGEPRSIVRLQPSPSEEEEISVVSGQRLPPILLACLDEWGNRTAPQPGMTWMLLLDNCDWINGDQAVQVLPTGEAWLKGLEVEQPESSSSSGTASSSTVIPREGMCVALSVRLQCETTPTQGVPAEIPALSIPLRIAPSSYPDSIEVGRVSTEDL